MMEEKYDLEDERNEGKVISLSMENKQFNNNIIEDIETININKMLEDIKRMNHKEQNDYLENKINRKDALKLLKKLSNSKYTELEEEKQTKVLLINSKKPLWIDDVKKTCKEIIPQIDMKDLENTKDMLIKEENEDIIINQDDYPYYITIKKLLYAFGDIYKANQRTIIYLHEFSKRFFVALSKIINECEFKKVLEHLYSYEYNKFYTYKKLKFKTSFEEINKNPNLDKRVNKLENMQNDEENINENDKEKDILSLDENLKEEMQIKDALVLDDEKDLELIEDSQENFLERKRNSKNYLETIFEDKDDNYFENLAFQDQRTASMTHTEYLEFISCRHQTFLSKGKKSFLFYLQTILLKNFPYEFKDQNNLELVSFILKEIFRKIVTQAIKSKHPGGENKLFVMNFPLLIEDFENLCNEEIEKLECFLSDYYSEFYLMKEFKKKRLNKHNNKNVKIRKTKNEILVIIKKFIFLEDNCQIEFLRKNKKSCEEKVCYNLSILIDKYTDVIKTLKNIFTKDNKPDSKVITRGRNKKNQRKKAEQVNSFSNQTEDKLHVLSQLFKMSDVLTNSLQIKNYYEYYLVKNYLIDDLEKKLTTSNIDYVDYKSIIEDIKNKIIHIKKVNKKTISKKFESWLNLETSEKNFIIDEFYKRTNTDGQLYYRNETEIADNYSNMVST